MRRRRLNSLSGLFFNTGERREVTVDDSFGFSRQFADTINEGMMEDERLEHKREREKNIPVQNPVHDPALKSNIGPGTSHTTGQTCL
ncbi:hypothetical protein H8S95_08865 [Pontibacter sp. KCTC 32443]|uniref:hypothetical protein n=1 Tax=Pontibacter TaxID=323449 RepID=UPI00164DD39F|nr:MULTISPECIES: hypothetical protein [Pontibacter]MBC5774171.1 hypothetical protein [Pontibacter sp. KCTC 32443]